MAEGGDCRDPGRRSPTPEPMHQLILATGRVQPSSELSTTVGVGTSVAVVEPGTGLVPDPEEEITQNGNDGDSSNIGPGGGNDSLREVFGQEENNRRSNSAPPCTPTSVSTVMPSSSLHHVARVPVQHVPAETVQQSGAELQSGEDRNISPDDLEEGSYLNDDMSPDPYSTSSPGPGGLGRVYKCRFCSFSTTIFTHLQFHMTKHSNHKVMKCALCDYCTTDKTLFRRHKRLHVRTNPTTVLRCEKCEYSTTQARKMREHYSHAHNEDYGPSLISTSTMSMRNVPFTNGTYTNLARNLCSPPTVRGGLDAVPLGGTTNSFHSFLAQPHGTTIQFGRGNPPHLITNCVNGGFAPAAAGGGAHHYDDGRRFLLREDNRMASDCLRNIVSNIISHPRVPATSTITSSNFYLTGSVPPHQPQCITPPTHHPHIQHHHQPPHHSVSSRQAPMAPHTQVEQVRVKVEPIDCDGVSDVSSSGAPALYERERERENLERQHHYMEPQTTSVSHQRLSFEPAATRGSGSMEQSDEVAPSGEAYRVSQSSEAASSRNETRVVSVGETGQVERRGSIGGGEGLQPTVPIKTEVSSVATQCSFTMKSETSGVTVAAAEQGSEWRRLRYFVIERGVQCELLSSTSPRRVTSRALSADSEQQSMTGSDTRCAHCGITFDDEVLFSIHLGCHSHTDPFICNVCGKKCYNKYGFYSHIMRGHHF